MAKKQEETGAPKVTSLPLPISDTPLVIDLPDGQKIVIGKMQPGSVIEVATWRGTGRPDSRTNRLMMGMNSGGATNPVTEAETKTESTEANQSKDLKSKVIFTVKKSATQIQTLVSQITVQLKKRKTIATKIQPASEESASALTSATEVDEWLQKVLERSEKRTAKALEKKAPAPKKPVKAVKKSAPKKSKR
jgi:hypothetical protein